MGKYNKGITLIALVITIIVLLILSGISIAMLTGENGILTKGNNAKEQTERQEVIENAKLKILEYETENEGKITDEKAYEIIAKYDKDYKENETFVFKTNDQDEEYFITEKGYTILVSEIYHFKKREETINFTIDGHPLTAKKDETWRDWLMRMKDEPEDVVGRYVWCGWHAARMSFHAYIDSDRNIFFEDIGGFGEVYLHDQSMNTTKYTKKIKNNENYTSGY